MRDAKSMLGDLAPFIRDPRQLHVGREIRNFSQRPREVLANWLICAVLNHQSGSQDAWTFSTSPGGGDGVLVNRATRVGERTEHVFVRPPVFRSVEAMIVAAVEKKQKKGGAAYAAGTHLVVFCDVGTDQPWYPNRVGEMLHGVHRFESVWAAGLSEARDESNYVYWVTQFERGVSPALTVWVDLRALEWCVEQVK